MSEQVRLQLTAAVMLAPDDLFMEALLSPVYECLEQGYTWDDFEDPGIIFPYLFDIMDKQVNNGGFIQLIYNGYGHYIFGLQQEFIHAMKAYGMTQLVQLLRDVLPLYEQYEEEIVRLSSEQAGDMEAFHALNVKLLPYFHEYNMRYFEEVGEPSKAMLRQYIQEHIAEFADII